MTEIASLSQYVNLIIIPVAILLIRLERRLTRIETILEIKLQKEEEKS